MKRPSKLTMTVGSIGTDYIEAVTMRTDRLVVRNIDLLKLNEEILNFLLHKKGLKLKADELQNLVEKSKVEIRAVPKNSE